MKKWYTSKTVLVGLLSLVIGILSYIQGQVDLGVALTVEGIIMVGLRLITNTKITK